MSQLQVIADAINERLRHVFPDQKVGLAGHIDFKLNRADGSVEEWGMHNLIMDAGEDEVAKLIADESTGDAFDYIAIGTDNTAADDGQTTLSAEISTNGGARAQDGTPTTSANVATINVTFNFTDPLAIVEVGLLNAAAAGDMLARQIFSVINVDDGDSLTVTWNITCGVAR